MYRRQLNRALLGKIDDGEITRDCLLPEGLQEMTGDLPRPYAYGGILLLLKLP